MMAAKIRRMSLFVVVRDEGVVLMMQSFLKFWIGILSPRKSASFAPGTGYFLKITKIPCVPEKSPKGNPYPQIRIWFVGRQRDEQATSREVPGLLSKNGRITAISLATLKTTMCHHPHDGCRDLRDQSAHGSRNNARHERGDDLRSRGSWRRGRDRKGSSAASAPATGWSCLP